MGKGKKRKSSSIDAAAGEPKAAKQSSSGDVIAIDVDDDGPSGESQAAKDVKEDASTRPNKRTADEMQESKESPSARNDDASTNAEGAGSAAGDGSSGSSGSGAAPRTLRTRFMLLVPPKAESSGKLFVTGGVPSLGEVQLRKVHGSLWASEPVEVPANPEKPIQYKYLFRPDQSFGEKFIRFITRDSDPTVREEGPNRDLRSCCLQLDLVFEHESPDLNLRMGPSQDPCQLYLRHIGDLDKWGDLQLELARDFGSASLARLRLLDLFFDEFEAAKRSRDYNSASFAPMALEFIHDFLRDIEKPETGSTMTAGAALYITAVWQKASAACAAAPKSQDMRGPRAATLLRALHDRTEGFASVPEPEKAVYSAAVKNLVEAGGDLAAWMFSIPAMPLLGLESSFLNRLARLSPSQRKDPPRTGACPESTCRAYVGTATQLAPSIRLLDSTGHLASLTMLFNTAPNIDALLEVLGLWWPCIEEALSKSSSLQISTFASELEKNIPRCKPMLVDRLRPVVSLADLLRLWRRIPRGLQAIFVNVVQDSVNRHLTTCKGRMAFNTIRDLLPSLVQDDQLASLLPVNQVWRPLELLIDFSDPTALRSFAVLFAQTVARCGANPAVGNQLVDTATKWLKKCFDTRTKSPPLGVFEALNSLPPQATKNPGLLAIAWSSCRQHNNDESILRLACNVGRNSKWRDEVKRAFVDGCKGILAESAKTPESALSALVSLSGSSTSDTVFAEGKIRADLLSALFGAIRGLDFHGDISIIALLKAHSFWSRALALHADAVVAATPVYVAAVKALTSFQRFVAHQTLPVGLLLELAMAEDGLDKLCDCFRAAAVPVDKSELDAAYKVVQQQQQRLATLFELFTAWQPLSMALSERDRNLYNQLREQLDGQMQLFGEQTLAQLSANSLEVFAPFEAVLACPTSEDSALSRLALSPPRLSQLLSSAAFGNVLQSVYNGERGQRQTEGEATLLLFAERMAESTRASVLLYAYHVCKLSGDHLRVRFHDVLRYWRDVPADAIPQLLELASSAQGSSSRRGQGSQASDVSAISEAVLVCLQVPDQVEICRHLLHCADTFNCSLALGEQDVLGRMEALLEREDSTVRDALEARKLSCRLLAIDAVDGDAAAVLRVLATPDGRELVAFLKRVGRENEELRHLIDAVEEHEDMFIRAETFRDLLDVRRFLQPLLKLSGSVADFVKLLLERPLRTHMASKMHVCNEHRHGLIRLYDTIANRSEVTKSAVRDAVQHGVYCFTASGGAARLWLEIPSQRKGGSRKPIVMDVSELQDVRSRALLILSSRSRAELGSMTGDQEVAAGSASAEDAVEKALSQQFIDESSLAEEVFRVLKELQSLSGRYREWNNRAGDVNALRELLAELTEHRDDCKEQLKGARVRHFCLLFFKARQIWYIYDFIDKDADDLRVSTRICNLVRFYEPCISFAAVSEAREQCRVEGRVRDTSNPDACFDLVAKFVASCAQAGDRAVSTPIQRSSGARHSDHTEAGRLFVAAIDRPESVVNVLFSLCMNDGYVPSRSQILFCSSSTTQEDLELLVERCRQAWKNGMRGRLFCIVHAELLEYQLQIMLAEFLRHLQQEASANPYRLAVLCCRRGTAAEQSQILTDFASSVVATAGLKDEPMREVAHQLLGHVTVFTSDAAGLGKSEEIRLDCLKKRMEPRVLTISGTVDAKSLAGRLNALELLECTCALHIDIGPVDSPQALNLFLLELLFLRTVSAEDETFHLPSVSVYVEIGGAAGGALPPAHSFCRCLQTRHLAWSLDRVALSMAPSSPEQLVCRYLQALDNGLLLAEDIPTRAVGTSHAAAIRINECRRLLDKYFFQHPRVPRGAPFAALRTFVNVLAYQLVKLSRSPFFRIHQLVYAMGQSVDIRALLLRSLIDMAAEFASLNDPAAKASGSAGADEIDRCVDRFSRMVQWSADDNNHLLVLFHPHGSITALYRDVDMIPSSIRRLLESQSVGDRQALVDYSRSTPSELLGHLLSLLSSTARPEAIDTSDYVVTMDNLLKMALILTRVRARVPVVIMGETGCGKTSLIRFLAKIAGVRFEVLNFHAGITDQHIERAVEKAERQAAGGEPVWVFFDEINTCDALGLVSEIICHHSVKGRRIAATVAFLAACNPYKKRSAAELAKQQQAGLKLKQRDDPMSKLVYRVHPLPEKLADFVWDFGSLTHEDEKQYIHAMVECSEFFRDRRRQGTPFITADRVVDLLVESQRFMLDVEGLSSVSLRDVRRCIFLMGRFLDLLIRRSSVDEDSASAAEREDETARKRMSGLGSAISTAFRYVTSLARGHAGKEAQSKEPGAIRVNIDVRAVVLALAHCYHCRLAGRAEREKYRALVSKQLRANLSADDLLAIIQSEQLDLLRRMELPPGTAMNEALLENVFVLLICIIHCIPVFLVGKPGCSKSLSMRLIYSNLRGPDSRDPFFRTLPQLYFLSYQGSEQSTSDGIQKVFDKADRYRSQQAEHDADRGRPSIMPVVLLDEVGLAEISRFNPLKVLHSLLEPGYPKVFPDVAVVGISNWNLDPAKMNRAIHLSRPEPDVDDLFKTAKAIVGASTGSRSTILDDDRLQGLATAYFQYQEDMKTTAFENFHGLRDYYSLVKSLAPAEARTASDALAVVTRALQRNFGGLSAHLGAKLLGKRPEDVVEFFVQRLKLGSLPTAVARPPVLDLIRDNWLDTNARHLLVASGCDATMGILQRELEPVLTQRNRNLVIIVGSSFPDDVGSEEYMYRVLSRIILSMEAGNCIILKDLNVYGSLYDMLNQNYAVVGKKRNCRVALGAYSNPMCHVDDLFRCIVVIDRDDVEKQDPPFLNRFEKQVISYDDILTDAQQRLIRELDAWVRDVCSVQGTSFDAQHPDRSLCGFNIDSLPSLVRLHASGEREIALEAALERCKADLVNTMTEDCIVRLPLTRLGTSDPSAARRITDAYRSAQEHRSLAEYMRHAIDAWTATPALWGARGELGVMSIVYTFSQPTASLTIEPHRTSVVTLGAIKREADFVARMKSFWSGACEDDLLVVQCSAALDRETMPLAKYLVEQHRGEYSTLATRRNVQPAPKHVLIVVHLDRSLSCSADFSHLGQWRQVTVDSLEPIIVGGAGGRITLDVQNLLSSSVADLLSFEGDGGLLDALFDEVLQWAFSAIRYSEPSSAIEHVKAVVAGVRSSPAARAFLKGLLVSSLRNDVEAGEHWAQSVAADFQALALSATLGTAILEFLRCQIRTPLAKLVYSMEREEALGTLVALGSGFAQSFVPLAADLKISLEDFAGLPPPKVEGYVVPGPFTTRRMPLSKAAYARVEEFRDSYALKLDALRERRKEDGMEDEEQDVAAECHRFLRASLSATVPSLFQPFVLEHMDVYVHDFAISVASSLRLFTSTRVAADVVAWLLRSIHPAPFADPVEVHAVWWDQTKEMGACLALLSACEAFIDLPAVVGGEGGGGVEGTRVAIADHLCKSILAQPSGSAEWLQTARFVVAQISAGGSFAVLPTGPIQLLRLCTELATCFRAPPQPRHADLLREVVKLGNGMKGEMLTSVSFVRGVLALIDRHVRAFNTDALDRFQSVFFVRCIEATDSPTDAAELIAIIVQRLLGTSPQLTTGSARVLAKLLTVAAEHADDTSLLGLYGDAIIQPALVASSPVLSAMEACTSQHPPDSPVWAFVADLLLTSQYARIGPGECAGVVGSRTSRELANCLRSACRTLQVVESGALKVIMASAFVRALFRAVASFFIPNSGRNDLCEHVEKALVDCFETASDRLESCTLVLLRAIRMQADSMSLQELRDWCSEHLSHRLAWMQRLQWKRVGRSRLDLDPFAGVAQYEAACADLDTFVIRELRDGVERHIAASAAGGIACSTFVQAVLSRFYLAGASAAPTDRERTARAVLDGMIEGRLPDSMPRRLLRSLLAVDRVAPAPGILELPHPCYLDLTPICEMFDLHLACLFAHFASLLASSPATASPFHAMFLDPASIARLFIPAAPSNEATIVERGLRANTRGEANRWYRHECGFWYSVGACGRPMQAAVCPHCAGMLGGAHHNPAPGNQAVDPNTAEQPGLIPEDPALLHADQLIYTERDMHPATFRVLHLLTYSSLAAAIQAGAVSEEQGRALFFNGDTRNCLHIVATDIGALMRIFSADEVAVCLALHGVIRRLASDLQAGRIGRGAAASAAARRKFEQEFAQLYVQPLIANGVGVAAADFRRACEPTNAEEAATLERELMEDYGQLLRGDYAQRYLPRLFATVQTASADGLRAAFALRPENAKKFPLLALLLEHEATARRLRRMRALLDWSRTLAGRLAHSVTRHEAGQRSVRSFVAEQGRRSPEELQFLERSFDAFAAAWNELRPSVTMYQCETLPETPEMGPDSAVALCLPERRDQGLFLCVGFDQMACLQNFLLHEATCLAKEGHPAVSFLASSASAFGEVAIQDARDADFCAMDLDDAFAQQHATCSLDLAGAGRSAVVYDFASAEAALAQRAFAGRRLVRVDPHDRALAFVRPFVYHLELFPSAGTIMEDINRKCRQEPLARESVRALEADTALKGRRDRLMSAMDVVLSTVNRVSGRWPEDLALGEFASHFEAASLEGWLLSLPVMRGLALRHVCGVYEALECICCEVVVECVAEQFKLPLPEGAERHMVDGLASEAEAGQKEKSSASEGAGEGAPARVRLEDLMVALRRFIFRYLAGTGADAAAVRQPLSEHLKREDLWRRAASAGDSAPSDESLAACVHEALTCAHTYHLYKALQAQHTRISLGAEPLSGAGAFAAAGALSSARAAAGLKRPAGTSANAGAGPSSGQLLGAKKPKTKTFS